MAKYSLELRELFEPIKFNPPLYSREQIENWFKEYDINDYLTEEQQESINNQGIWNKDKLAKKIVDHYYMREIGFETPMLFHHYAKVTMQELMEEYLPLIYSASIKYDPLVNVDFTETFERSADTNVNGTSSGTSNSSSTSSGLNVGSDTPQGQINKNDILNGRYASSTSANENNINDNTSSNTNSTNSSDTNEEYTKRVKGNSGVSATAQKMVQQYRDNIRAINKEIINKLQDLFMQLY